MKRETDQNIEIFRTLYFITLLEICLVWIFNMIELIVCLRLALNAMIGIVAVMLIYEKVKVLEAQEEKIENTNVTRWFIAIGYLVSLFWVLLSAREQVYELWMFGTIWIAFLVSPYMAMGFQVIFAYLYCVLNHMSVETFVLYVILGWVACGLSGHMKKKKAIVVSFIILISAHVTIIFLMNYFQFNLSTVYYMLYSIASFMIELLLVMMVDFIKERRKRKSNIEQSEKIDEKSKKSRYQVLLNLNFPLVKKMQERSKYLYRHSLKVAVEAGEAAKAIGANEQLAQVGGLYHDIGKILEGDDIENGKKLALEYGFPEEVIVIIESYNVKFNKPKTIEAAIVMFADNIISSMDVLQARHGDLTKNRHAIIRKIFEVRFEDGTLDESGLTFEQYRNLKKYFEEHI